MDLASASVTGPTPSRAAQYVRISTEHQQYSPENQLEIIRQYAAAHNMEIVQDYSDQPVLVVTHDGKNLDRCRIAQFFSPAKQLPLPAESHPERPESKLLQAWLQ